MVKSLRLFLFTFVLLTALISTASAEIWFVSQPKSVYNIGDVLEISIAVSQTGEQFNAELVCGGDVKMMLLKYLANETTVSIYQPLTKSFLNDVKGSCKVVTFHRQEEAESLDFTISDSVSLRFEKGNINCNPGEEIEIAGEAIKANTLPLNGFFELSFKNAAVSGVVSQGKFKSNFAIPKELAAGDYLIDAKAYEKEGEKITNTGKGQISVSVKQIPSKVDIALNSQSIKPGNSLDFKVFLYDQSGRIINGESSFSIEDLNGNSLYKSLTKIDRDESFFIEKNLPSKYYIIKAYSAGLNGKREFYVGENEEAEFKIINGTLIIKNAGNVKYSKAVQIKINDVVEIVVPELEVGQEKQYELAAPDGEYSISVTDGVSSLADGASMLTGSAISVREVGENFFEKRKLFAWGFLVLVLGMFVFVASRNILKRKFVLSEQSSSNSSIPKLKTINSGKAEERVVIQRDVREAEHSMVIKGQKQDAAFVCVKIKNQIGNTAKENLQKIFERAYENKAAVYKSGDYTIAIFSPLLTKTFTNHLPAVTIATEIARELQEYNKKFKERIDFGISVHSGDIVNRVQENKLMFTSLGNAASLAKKMAEASKGEVLLSKEIHEKTLSDIKADKQEIAGLEVFTIRRIASRDNNSRFIQDFLKRQEDSKNHRKV